MRCTRSSRTWCAVEKLRCSLSEARVGGCFTQSGLGVFNILRGAGDGMLVAAYEDKLVLDDDDA